jgi:hypothetical protein
MLNRERRQIMQTACAVDDPPRHTFLILSIKAHRPAGARAAEAGVSVIRE